MLAAVETLENGNLKGLGIRLALGFRAIIARRGADRNSRARLFHLIAVDQGATVLKKARRDQIRSS